MLHPELEQDKALSSILSDLDDNLAMAKNENVGGILTMPVNSHNDTMRALLGKMQEYRKSSEGVKTDPPKEVRIARISVKKEDANAENGDMVAKRIIDCFNKLYTGTNIQIDYGIAQMEGNGLDLFKKA